MNFFPQALATTSSTQGNQAPFVPQPKAVSQPTQVKERAMNQPTTRPAVLNQSISGYRVYFAGKNHKFGNNVEAARAYVKACNATLVAPATKEEVEAEQEAINQAPQSPEQEAANAPTPREMLDIMDAETKDLREQLKMAQQLNAKLVDAADNTETSNIGFDVRGQLKMLASAPRRNDATYKRAIKHLELLATDLVNG